MLGSAVNAFFGHVLEANAANAYIAMKWRIHDVIGSGNHSVLFDLLPNLQKWLGDGHVAAADEQRTPTSGVKGMGSSHRLKFMFCKLLAAIASESHPLILFLDDLQWADAMTVRRVGYFRSATNAMRANLCALCCFRYSVEA